jgi:hypothetical protein
MSSRISFQTRTSFSSSLSLSDIRLLTVAREALIYSIENSPTMLAQSVLL